MGMNGYQWSIFPIPAQHLLSPINFLHFTTQTRISGSLYRNELCVNFYPAPISIKVAEHLYYEFASNFTTYMSSKGSRANTITAEGAVGIFMHLSVPFVMACEERIFFKYELGSIWVGQTGPDNHVTPSSHFVEGKECLELTILRTKAACVTKCFLNWRVQPVLYASRALCRRRAVTLRLASGTRALPVGGVDGLWIGCLKIPPFTGVSDRIYW